MKNANMLNKKGFTLIELLAVIVVLAIVLVVTIPSVLSSMNDAKKKQFENAISTINEYIEEQIAACQLGDTSLAEYDSEIFLANTCKIDFDKEKIVLKNAGYSMNDNLRCNVTNDTSDFCSLSFNEDGSVDELISPSGSKFGKQSFATSG